jgi:hypothetical protein
VGAGANQTARHRDASPTWRFNPHPPVGAGATCAGLLRQVPLSAIVSILTRPWGRVQPRCGDHSNPICLVSILTRPWGRVQLANSIVQLFTTHACVFQSSPARGGGCNANLVHPHARGGGCNCLQNPPVSILTRPWGRVQPCRLMPMEWILTRPRVDVSILTRPWGRVQRYLYARFQRP